MTVAAPRRIISAATDAQWQRGLTFTDADALERRLVAEARRVDGRTAWLIVWLDFAVLVGLVDGGGLRLREPLEPRYLQELRLFGDDGEWWLWREGAAFAARRRVDGSGATADILADDQSLWGTAAQPSADGWTQVAEARGIRYALPVPVRESDLPLRLVLHHYLGFDEAGMVGVADSRLVAICDQRGAPLLRRVGTDA